MFIEIKNDSEINEDVILNSKEISVIFLKKNSLCITQLELFLIMVML